MLYDAAYPLLHPLEPIEDGSGCIGFENIFLNLVLGNGDAKRTFAHCLLENILLKEKLLVDLDGLQRIAQVRVWTPPLKEEDQPGLI